MVRKGRYVHVCPACERETFRPRCHVSNPKFRDVVSKFDGLVYPSCRRVVLLCQRCFDKRWREGEQTCMQIPDSRSKNGHPGGSSLSATDPGLLRPFSELLIFLTGSVSETGAERKPGNLSLRLQSGTWGLSLTDAETGQYCFVEGKRLDDLLLMVEMGLGDGGLPWRASAYQQRPKGRK